VDAVRSMHEKIKNAQKIVAGKPKGKISLQTPRHRWKNIIKINLEETVCKDMD